MIDMDEIKFDPNAIKEKYLEARKRSVESGNKDSVYTEEMILALRDMAELAIYPDWRFGDDECRIWSAFHLFNMRVRE